MLQFRANTVNCTSTALGVVIECQKGSKSFWNFGHSNKIVFCLVDVFTVSPKTAVSSAAKGKYLQYNINCLMVNENELSIIITGKKS